MSDGIAVVSEVTPTRARGGRVLGAVVDDFVRQHPWPSDLTADGAPIEFLWEFDVAASPRELWPFVMDTSRFNRALGMSRMTYREIGGVLHGSTRNAGMLQEWVEAPWTWVSEKTLTCIRSYRRGFARHVRSIYVLEPSADGTRTRMQVYFGWIARSAVWRWFLRATFPSVGGGYAGVLGAIEQLVRARRMDSSALARPAPALAPESRARLTALQSDLHATLSTRGVDGVALDRLAEHLATGDEMDLHRMQLQPLARAWRVDPSELLVVFLHATRAGLLSMSWDVICPHCRGVRQEARTLGDVPKRGQCETCEIDFETDTENSIEITFHPHPSIRDVPKQQYCAAEPATKPHIQVQQRVAPGASCTVATALAPGRYRVRIAGERRYRYLDVASASSSEPVRWRVSEAGDLSAMGPAPRLELVNDTDEAHTFVAEVGRWSDDALRPVQLFTLQEFRDLFTEEYVSADVQLSVGEQTILFTDMIGSTRFYDSRGDPQAFAEVKRHFAEVYEVVKRHRGAVVKTIGDAVMAAFHDPVDALRASVGIHARFPEGRADSSIRLRISMNRGPCIAVNLNSAIDFFGRTVNVASKLQACVEAGQVSFPRVMRDAPGVADYLAAESAKLEEVVVTSASLREPIVAYRWDVNSLVPSCPAAE